MGDIQFVLIKRTALVFLALLLASIAFLCGSFFYKQVQLDEERIVKAQIRSTRSQIANIMHDSELINTYQSAYTGLIDKGFFDEENRLAWIEQLDMTVARLVLPDLHYQIDSQYELKKDLYSTPHGMNLFKSQLTFQTSLLHEGDLLELIADLKGLSSGLLIVDQCLLSRRNKAVNNVDKKNKLNFNFHARCTVFWYTAGEIAAPALPLNNKA